MILLNQALKEYNTFGIDVKGKKVIMIKSASFLSEYLNKHKKNKFKVLGGGSNILFTKTISETVLLNRIKFMRFVDETHKKITYEVGGGILWHDWVTFCVQNKWQGLENLALIPGTVGAAPIQNIGAYGLEQKDAFVSLKAVNLFTGATEIFGKKKCEFAYRDSVFKKKYKEQYFIVSVTYELNKNELPTATYRDLELLFFKKNITRPTIQEIYDSVVEIRTKKLPFPRHNIGNGGSFFKNPIISKNLFNELCVLDKHIPKYVINKDFYKIPAAYLIEHCGWKGYRKGNIGVHKHQALVLLNYGGATGNEILALAQAIQRSVIKKYGITIDLEINVW